MLVPMLLLSLEALVLAADYFVNWLRGERPILRRMRCPLDGKPARLTLVDVRGVVEPVNLVRCSLLETGAVRSCDRACVRR